MATIWNYYGVFFDDATKEYLYSVARKYIPDGWKIYCHHMTIIYNNGSDERNKIAEQLEEHLGEEKRLTINGIGISDRAIAFSVDYKETQNTISHITVATSPEAKPVESNYITNWKKITPFTVVGTLDKVKKTIKPKMEVKKNINLKKIIRESIIKVLSESIESVRISRFMSKHGGLSKNSPKDGLGDITDDMIVYFEEFPTSDEACKTYWKLRQGTKEFDIRKIHFIWYSAKDDCSIVVGVDKTTFKTGFTWGGETSKKAANRYWDKEDLAKSSGKHMYQYQNPSVRYSGIKNSQDYQDKILWNNILYKKRG